MWSGTPGGLHGVSEVQSRSAVMREEEREEASAVLIVGAYVCMMMVGDSDVIE